ncbi:MAG: DNA integrity scanning diadenylate cyclase DisA [Actinomycetota bacterium]|nr:DNA integrity scanning diadenylate cyclase DisA [Actinomycetota bacterium]
MFSRRGSEISTTLSLVAPGAPLRSGLDRILQARMGALVVVGDGPEVLSICTGGFLLDTEYSPQRLYELAKMDGAIILSSDGRRIARANVHLMPDPKVPTSETGTRHRTAERVARSLRLPVLSVSEEQSVITVYKGELRRSLSAITALLSKSNQALATLERYKNRLEEVINRLDNLEAAGAVNFRDVVLVLQRFEMVRRISEEIEASLVELGSDGRLVSLQLNELTSGFELEYRSMVEDYMGACSIMEADQVIEFLGSLETEDLLIMERVGKALLEIPLCSAVWKRIDGGGSSRQNQSEGEGLPGRGMRELARMQDVPVNVKTAILNGLPSDISLLDASENDLSAIHGVNPTWARVVAQHFRSLVSVRN